MRISVCGAPGRLFLPSARMLGGSRRTRHANAAELSALCLRSPDRASWRALRVLGAARLGADPAQRWGASPFHPVYLRQPGTFSLLVRPNHGINGGAKETP